MLKRLRRGGRRTEPARTPQEKLGAELGLLEEIARHGGLIRFGAPTRCPTCGEFGLIDEIAGDQQANKCLRCGASWAFSRKAVALFQSAGPSRTSQTVIGSGVLVDNISDLARMTRERFVDLGSAMRRTREVIFGAPRTNGNKDDP